MKTPLHAVLALCLLVAATFTSIAPAQAGLLEPLLMVNTFPTCENKHVIKRIVKRFNYAEKKTFHRGFLMQDVNHIRERDGLDDYDTLIQRRYCAGNADLTNGRHPTVFYMIEAGQGFAGLGFRVEFCVNGLDPWREFDGHCRTLRY